jgi:hypothetical protein
MNSGIWQWLFEPWSRKATMVRRRTSRLYSTVQRRVVIMPGWWLIQPTVGLNKCTNAKRPICGSLPPSQSQVAMIVIGCNRNTSTWVMAVADSLHLMVSVMVMIEVRAMKYLQTDVAWCVPSVTLSFADCVVNHGQVEATASPTTPCPVVATEESYRVQTTLSSALSQQALGPECAPVVP